jgi:hypothetical protein
MSGVEFMGLARPSMELGAFQRDLVATLILPVGKLQGTS